MKVPANFNASATRKASPLEAAVNGIFSGAAVSEPQSQISNALSQRQGGSPKPDNAKPDDGAPAPARREVKEKFLVSMSKGERSVFKAFCAMQNVSMNHFVMCAMDYFKEDLENGKVSLSAHSYKRKES